MQLEKRKENAKLGRTFWLDLVDQYHIDITQYVIVLPSDNKKYNEPALKYLSKFLKKRGVEKAYILTFDEWVMNQKKQETEISEYDLQNVEIIAASKEQIECLVQFYCLYEFASNVIIGSLTDPSGRMGDQLVGIKGLTSDEVFAGIVYSLVDEE